MKRIAIVTDSSAGIPPDMREHEGIVVVPHRIRFGKRQFLDGVELDAAGFFRLLGSEADRPMTGQPGEDTFAETFRRLAVEYDEIVAVLLSSKLSSAFAAAVAAAERVRDGIAIEVVDSYNTSLALAFQAVHAAELARAGHDASEIARRLRANVDAYHLVFFVDSLEFLEQGGRVGRATSLVGDFLNLKPLLRVDEGQVVPVERARTRERAIDQLRQFVATWPSPIARLGIVYSSDRVQATRLARDLAKFAPSASIPVTPLSPVLCTHVGPGALGICLAEPDIR